MLKAVPAETVTSKPLASSDWRGRIVGKMADLPAEFAEAEDSDEIMKTRALLQFIMDWNSRPEARDYMLEEDIPEDCPRDWAAAIAAVVHALCERDNHPFPVSLKGIAAEQDILITLDPIDSPYTRQVRSQACEVCWEHKVFFTAETLEKR